MGLIFRGEDPSVSASLRDIYNIRAEAVREERHGQPPAQALINNLTQDQIDGHIFSRYQLDTSNRLSMLFFAVSKAVHHARLHFEVVIMDCTHQTNKFDMPLLHFVGVDHHGNSFTIGLCFMDREVQTNYDQALRWLIDVVYTRDGVILWPSTVVTDCEIALTNAIDQRFPPDQTKRILCRWHLMKNVSNKCKHTLVTEERWDEFDKAIHCIMDSKTIDEYEDTVQELKTESHYCNGTSTLSLTSTRANIFEDAAAQNPEQQAVSYVLGQWFGSQKEFIVAVWVDKYFHCGTTATSRVEGGHRRLKD